MDLDEALEHACLATHEGVAVERWRGEVARALELDAGRGQQDGPAGATSDPVAGLGQVGASALPAPSTGLKLTEGHLSDTRVTAVDSTEDGAPGRSGCCPGANLR